MIKVGSLKTENPSGYKVLSLAVGVYHQEQKYEFNKYKDMVGGRSKKQVGQLLLGMAGCLKLGRTVYSKSLKNREGCYPTCPLSETGPER